MLDTIVHKWLRVPYALNVYYNRRVKGAKTTVLFIHGIGNSGAAWKEVVERLPSDTAIMTIDLLGFGKSPRPAWATYNAKTQARSIIATLLKLRLAHPVVVVGHSLGALVAVEVARRYPLLVRRLILCSPPFYKRDEELEGLLPQGDKILRRMFRYSKDHPEYLLRIAPIAIKYGLVNAAFHLDDESVPAYVAALEASIINQTALHDARRVNKPMTIMMGQFDPVVIKKNLRQLAHDRSNIELVTVLAAGHEVRGAFVPAVVKEIEKTK